jgi:hypothetical protein
MPRRSEAGEQAARQRRERQAAALRANLARRKQQQRDRAGDEAPSFIDTPTLEKPDPID